MPKFRPLEVAQGEFKILGSRFIAALYPINNMDEAKPIADAFRREVPHADHYPYGVYLAGQSKSSDDGEPGGSAGIPLVSLLKDHNIEGLLIVARFFGGTKLGIPRLRRAFCSAATSAVENARLGMEKEVYSYPAQIDYSDFESLKNYAKSMSFLIDDVEFGIKIEATLRSGDRLDELGQKKGLSSLVLKEPSRSIIYEETK